MHLDRQHLTASDHIDVSIIISTHNRKDELISTINNIMKNTTGSYEIIVVSASSTDGTDEELERLFPAVKLIRAPDVGWGESNNIGAKVAKGDFFYFSGPDMEFETDWLSEMLNSASRVDNLGSIGCVLFREYLGKGTLITGGLNLRFLYVSHHGIDLSQKKYKFFLQKHIILDVDAVSYPMVPREVFYKVGGFDPEYFYIADETDFGLRIKKLGLRNVIFFRKWTKTAMNPFSEKIFYYWHRNWVRLIIKMNNFFALPFALTYPFLKFTIELVLYSITRRKNLRNLILRGMAWNFDHFNETRSSLRLKYIRF